MLPDNIHWSISGRFDHRVTARQGSSLRTLLKCLGPSLEGFIRGKSPDAQIRVADAPVGIRALVNDIGGEVRDPQRPGP